MKPLILFLGVGALACAGAGKDDTGSDTPPTGTATTDAGLCGPWTGYVDGRTWRYAYAADAATQGEWTDEIGPIGADGTAVIHEELSQTNADTAYTASNDTEVRCDTDGLWILSTHATWASTFDGTTSEGWSDGVYDTSGPVQPRQLAVGDTWDWSYDLSFTASYGDGEQSGRAEYEVEAEEEIEVPAGTYPTLTVFQTNEQGASLRAWYAKDVGLVATESAELVAVYE